MTDLIDEKPENQEAFPTCGYEGIGGEATYQPGMTLRDYFAAKIMNGFVSDTETQDTLSQTRDEGAYRLALLSYKCADAMLKARAK